MEIAPLIHSRTFYSDFNQNFAARPKDLNVQWAMNKILPAMRDVDILDGVRRVVSFDGDLGISGVACNFRYFVEKYLSAEEREDAKNYLHDERGREVKIFLGYAFKGDGVPDVSDSKLWQMFNQTVAQVWKNNPAATVIVSYENCDVKNIVGKPLDKTFYQSNENDDIEIFEQCISARKDFCSNVDAVKIFEEGKYSVITASTNVINRLQSDTQKKTPLPNQSSEQKNPSQQISQPPTQTRTAGGKPLLKKSSSSPPLMIFAIVLIVIIVVLFLVKD